MKPKQVFYARKFLNKRGVNGLAAVLAAIYVGENYIDAELTISDCSRSINLDVWSDDEQGYKIILNKLETLIDTLSDFKEAYQEAAHELEVRKKKTKPSSHDAARGDH